MIGGGISTEPKYLSSPWKSLVGYLYDMDQKLLYKKDFFESLYEKYNRKEFIHPDPLEFLYQYPDICDREIVGLIASSLAYGRVAQILKSVTCILSRMVSPSVFLRKASIDSLQNTFRDFKHRFTTGEEVSFLLLGIKRVVERYGSLERCFVNGLKESHETILPALSAFVEELLVPANGRRISALAIPNKGSACKRLNLFLRWMVRRDGVDLGGWNGIPKSKLIVPLDTHMHRIALCLGITRRKQANMRVALEITSAFRDIAPGDPVKYDFALTRLGIRNDINFDPVSIEVK